MAKDALRAYDPKESFSRGFRDIGGTRPSLGIKPDFWREFEKLLFGNIVCSASRGFFEDHAGTAAGGKLEAERVRRFRLGLWQYSPEF